MPEQAVIRANRLRVCAVGEVPDGGARGFSPAGGRQHTVFVTRRGSIVRMWADRCPHQGTPMAWRQHAYLNAAGDRIVCAAHGALFDVDSGVCVQGPCLGQRLTAVPFHIDAAGDIVLGAVLPRHRA